MPAVKTAPLTVIILTYNEEVNLPACLSSLADLPSAVFVVDSGSTDRTADIAREYNAEVTYHPFQNQAAQLNWALETLPITTDWVMRLDADERLTPALVQELRRELPTLPPEITGLWVKRRVYFMGKWIRYGGYYPTWLLRIWRNGAAYCEQRWMDEHMVLRYGTSAKLQNDIIDENHKGLSFWINKHNSYADREMLDLLNTSKTRQSQHLQGQAALKRWLKENLYARSPLFWRAFAYWFYRYFIRLGFLDGKEGLVFHFLQACWYRFLVDAKLYERHLKVKNH